MLFAASCRPIHSLSASTGTRTDPPIRMEGMAPLEMSSYAFDRETPIASAASVGLSSSLFVSIGRILDALDNAVET